MADVEAPASLIEYDGPIALGEGESAKKVMEAQKAQAATGESKAPASQLDEILHAVLPPREFLDKNGNGDRYMQYVSNNVSTRIDVIKLQEKLDERLMLRQARETGICPVREDLYRQCFDELIRQITLNCPERGLLTLRVRDEIRMTTDAYKTLYESSVAFGVRKQMEAEEGMPQLEKQVKELEEQKKSLEGQVVDLLHRSEVIEKRAAERRQLEMKKQKEEVEFLKYQSEHLESFFKAVSAKAGIK
jgi:dynein light intermediate chain